MLESALQGFITHHKASQGLMQYIPVLYRSNFFVTLCIITQNQVFLSHQFSFFQGAKTGKDNGYTMLFDIEAFDYSYYDEGSEGLKVSMLERCKARVFCDHIVFSFRLPLFII